MFSALHSLGTKSLLDLANHCETAVSPGAPTLHALQQLVGAHQAGNVDLCICNLTQSGWTVQQVGALCRAIHDSRISSVPEQTVDIVLSGPEVSGTPTRDTQAVMHSLLVEAVTEVLLVGYVIHNALTLFEPLARRMSTDAGLNVWCCLDVGRSWNDTTPSDELLRKFASDFRVKHWPWEPRPKVYYDPRSLDPPGPTRSSLHAKCLVVDRKAALVTSANFTQAALQRNIECGVVIRNHNMAERIARYFEGLKETHHLLECRV